MIVCPLYIHTREVIWSLHGEESWHKLLNRIMGWTCPHLAKVCPEKVTLLLATLYGRSLKLSCLDTVMLNWNPSGAGWFARRPGEVAIRVVTETVGNRRFTFYRTNMCLQVLAPLDA